MAMMYYDEEGDVSEPCLSCDKAYIEDIWYEWCCDEKVCVKQPDKGVEDGE